MSPESEETARRIRTIIGLAPQITEKNMFGGVCFMFNGHMVAGSMKSGQMLVRVSHDDHDELKTRPGAEPMIQGGKEMVGFILVGEDGIEDEPAMREWIELAERHVKTLPPKKK